MKKEALSEERSPEGAEKAGGEPHVNLRPLLFCAIGLAFGIFLYGKCRFGGIAPSDFLFLLLFVVLALFPLGKARSAAIFLSLALFAGIGAIALHLFSSFYFSAESAEDAKVTGVAISVSVRKSYSVVVLRDLEIDGEEVGGKLRVILSGPVLPGDRLLVHADVEAQSEEDLARDGYAQSLFASDIRYLASASSVEKVGRSSDPFLRFNGALFTVLHENLDRDEADLCYALLTGSSGSMDEDLGDAVRRGGIAHVFAVSGLHIGILFGAVQLACSFLKRYRFAPALAVSFLYCGVCGFTVSSVRALVMCGVLGIFRALGRKHDFLQSVSCAGLFVLLFLPAQWYAAGMRLSFGACLGLALFSGSLSRLFSRLRMPKFLSGYLSAALSVQAFTFPVLMESFGYFSVWGFLLNFFLIPVLPVLFLCTLISALLALVLPFAAPFFCLFPQGCFSALLYLFAATDLTFVLSGFALGAGGAVWLAGMLLLTPRVRIRPALRSAAVCGAALAFSLAVMLENVVFSGARIDTYSARDASSVLLRTPSEAVLIVDGEIGERECRDFLRRTYGGTIDLVVVLAEDELSGVNAAAFLDARSVRVRDPLETGLSVPVFSGDSFACGSLSFRYLARSKLLVFAEGLVVEVDFGGTESVGADFFLDGRRGGLKYFLEDGIIETG